MNTSFILIASGVPSTPSLDISVQGRTTGAAIELAKLMVAHLSKAAYTRFELFDVRGDHVKVASFRVDTPEPVVLTL